MNFFDFDERTFIGLGITLYCGAFVYGLTWLIKKRKHRKLLMLSLVLAGFASQTLGLFIRGIELGRCPLGNPFEKVQFVVWSAVMLYLFIGPAFRMSLLGFFSSGLAAILGATSLFITGWDVSYHRAASATSGWVETHAALAVFSYGIFGILALTSFMYLLQNYGLKKKRFTGLFPILPSIVQLDQMNRRLLLMGVAVLTVSLGVGAVYFRSHLSDVQSAKIVTTVALWLAYTILLLLQRVKRLAAKKFALSCILLFVLALITLWPVTISGRGETESTPTQLTPDRD